MVPKDQEREIPITTDTRTMEQRKHDMVQNLERKQKSMNGNGEPKSTQAMTPAQGPSRHDWFDEVGHWIDETCKRWNDDMRRMHHSVFTLLPMTQSDLEPLAPADAFGPFGHIPPILHRMERQMNALRHHLAMEPPEMMMLPSGSTAAGTMVPRECRSGDVLDFLKDAYEVGENGQLHFKVRFDVRGFGPDNLKVTTSKNRLTVCGKKIMKTGSSSSSSEFCRTIYLPDSVDESRFESRLTGDGILMLEAPVKTPDYKALTFDNDGQLAIKPQPPQMVQLKATGVVGPQVMPDGPTGKKLHVEVPIEPGFNADDLLVRMDSNRMIVSGRKHMVEGSGDKQSTHMKEFMRSYMIPETVDPLSMKSQLSSNMLVVEAPMLR